MALARFNIRLDPTQVASLEALARRLSFEQNAPLTWGWLLRTGAAWVLALEGRTPAEIQNTTTKTPR